MIDLCLIRGGSWCSYPRFCRSTCRARGPTYSADSNVGFRVVCLSQGNHTLQLKEQTDD